MCLLSFAGFWDRMIRGGINSLYKLRGHLVVPMDNKVTAHFLLHVNRKMQKEPKANQRFGFFFNASLYALDASISVV